MKDLHEYFYLDQITPEQLDWLLEQGWRHFGTYFFRYSNALVRGHLRQVMPLRIDLTAFSHSRSQKRILAKNRDLQVVIRPSFIDEAKEDLFYFHRNRFKDNTPDSIYTFLSEEPASVPCTNREICAYEGDRLLAASFLDVGRRSTSAVYAFFDPEESRRSLGIYTMLEAIRYSCDLGCRYYYPGYAYRVSSIYDYKKNFEGLETFDWKGSWHPIPRENMNQARQ
jgi:arginine-tRNA-protein transferase